ncbi:hypothetical protein C8J57DRAFT_1249385 [Mycena rebaudengoi]|nr:hypothetical protein C8J57DRAFT_1249385 [Mycena rebaudengoi]
MAEVTALRKEIKKIRLIAHIIRSKHLIVSWQEDPDDWEVKDRHKINYGDQNPSPLKQEMRDSVVDWCNSSELARWIMELERPTSSGIKSEEGERPDVSPRKLTFAAAAGQHSSRRRRSCGGTHVYGIPRKGEMEASGCTVKMD